MYDPNKVYPLPGLKEIPLVSAVKYEEKGNETNSDYITDSHYLEIEGNKTFIVDFIVWTKDSQIKLVCKVNSCQRCEKVEKVLFSRRYSAIELLVDKPDSRDNTSILFKVKETVLLY